MLIERWLDSVGCIDLSMINRGKFGGGGQNLLESSVTTESSQQVEVEIRTRWCVCICKLLGQVAGWWNQEEGK